MYLSTVDFLSKYILLILCGSLLLHYGGLLFIPMLFGLLIAFVVYPICLWLENKHMPRYLAITICMTIILLLSFLLIYLLGWQLQLFSAELPIIVQKLKIILIQVQKALQDNLSFIVKTQQDWAQNVLLNSSSKITSIVNTLFQVTSNALFMLFLTPVYTVLFLYHRHTFVNFAIMAIGKKNEEKIRLVILQAVLTYARFVKGMLLVYSIVGILNTIGLYALGIPYALLFGMFTAIMTIIPYIGIILSSLLPIAAAFITKDSIWYPVGVIIVFAIVQYLEANVIFPKVVGTQLNLSTWATLTAMIYGGIIWGVSGMILFIPMVAILKIIAQNIPEWEAVYILLKRN